MKRFEPKSQYEIRTEQKLIKLDLSDEVKIRYLQCVTVYKAKNRAHKYRQDSPRESVL